MHKIGKHILCFILLLVSCKTNDYNTIINKANSYQWYNNMKEAEKSLKLTEKAINLEPNTWDGYALELNIYSTWNHKSKDFPSNFTALKFVYEKWIANGNKLSISQQLGYANTLFCLNNKIKSDLLYFEIIEYYTVNKNILYEDERDYICYMICQIMLNDIDKTSFNTIKLDLYNDNGINDYLLDEINNLKQTGKKGFAERYCVLL